jgi:hypothetical protein
MEGNVILIASGIYGFLLAPKGVSRSENTMFLELAWYLVPIFSFLSFIRWRDSGDLIRALADYIRENVETDIPHQSVRVAGYHHRRALQKPLASRTVLQMAGGSLLQITMSASLPGAITPISPSRPMTGDVVLSIVLIIAGIILTLRARP